MPWQQAVVDVVMEIDPLTGRFAYNEFGLTVPRQSGKSTLILAKAVHRATASEFFGPRQRLVYTAQTRNKAREKWEEDYVADLMASRTLGRRVRAHFGNGNEHLRFPNGSRFGIEANTEKAGHGGTLDETYIDEAFAQLDNRLEQAFRPAMITRVNTQLGWVSTAGWLDGSPYLIDKVRRGRDQAEMGVREGLAYFEWSAPDDADIEDRDVWRACMPALGHTITEATIAGELDAMVDTPNDFRRAYLNQWVLKDNPANETVVDLNQWAELESVAPSPPSPLAFAVEVSEDRKWSSIAMAGVRADGLRQVSIVQAKRGTSWVPDRLVELIAKWKPVAVGIRPSGPAGSLIPALEHAKVELTKVSAQDMAQACGLFVDGVEEATLRHNGERQVTVALGAARYRTAAGARTFIGVDADIGPLQAETMALFVLTRGGSKRTGAIW